ncbi:MAG: RNA polymerase sigma factor [Pirellulales bacterium]|nr:RNA polymerase sigma factor [Pirellulales bacterium]
MSPRGLEPERLESLLARHAGPLMLYARGWSETPEDVVQEALVQLLRQPRTPENVVGWLYRTVRNRAISHARSRGRRRRHETAASSLGEPWFVPTNGQRLDAQAATEALGQLPEEEREVVVARLWGGLSFAEIARLTETSSSTAWRRYESGLVALRERLGVSCPEKKNSRTN